MFNAHSTPANARCVTPFVSLLRLAKCVMFLCMTTLAEIETAAAALSDAEKQQLMLFLASRLQAQASPLADSSARAQEMIFDWMAEDEAAMRRIHPEAQG